MISFIIIGRNEEKNLKRCIDGIYKAIAYNDLRAYEIIYVDSKSTDQSVNIASQFGEVKIFAVTGECNAAIGRNIGAKHATGNAFFFIDADMEISGEFLAGVWDKNNLTISHDVVSGELIDIIGTAIEKRLHNKSLPGGIFLIKKDIWHAVNGMRTKYRTGEDYDIGLRIIEKGYHFVRKDEIITNHYTVPNLDRSRIWKAVWNKSAFYPRCVLLRDHLFTKERYQLLFRNDKTFILFVIALVALAIYPLAGVIFFGIYLLAVIFRITRSVNYLPLIHMLGYYILTDLLNLVYFFTFFPKNKKEEWRPVSAIAEKTV